MLGIEQFKKLQELKELGVSKLKVSEKLNLSYKTVCKWWDKDVNNKILTLTWFSIHKLSSDIIL